MNLDTWKMLFADYGVYALAPFLLAGLRGVWGWLREQEYDLKFHMRSKRKQ